MRSRTLRLVAAMATFSVLVLVGFPPLARAQQRRPRTQPSAPPQAPAPSAQPAQAAADTMLLSQLKYRYIGPVGNRFSAVAGVPGDPNTYYAGAASGGIWKTTDGGIHWEPIFDKQPVSSIGALAVAPSDPNVVWAGTGESFIRSHISMDPHGPRQYRPHRACADSPDGPGRGVRLRPRARLRPAGRTRRLPHPGWGENLGSRAVRGSEHRLFRHRDGPEQSADPVRGHVAARDPHLGSRERRAGKRPLQVHRRRGNLEEGHRQRTADQSHRQTRPRHRPYRPEPHLRVDRNRRRRPLPRPGDRPRHPLAFG